LFTPFSPKPLLANLHAEIAKARREEEEKRVRGLRTFGTTRRKEENPISSTYISLGLIKEARLGV